MVSIGKHTAMVKESQVVESVPCSNPRSSKEIQAMAENYIGIYDDGKGDIFGERIMKGYKCIVSKPTKIIIKEGMPFFLLPSLTYVVFQFKLM